MKDRLFDFVTVKFVHFHFSLTKSEFKKIIFLCCIYLFLQQVPIDVEGFVNSFRSDIMEVVYAWAKGAKFYEIMEITQVFEGSLIRAIRRLEEVLQQLIEAAKSIGETQLEAKFQEAVTKIKRDIVFAASLYL